MFTGIIEAVCTVSSAARTADAMSIRADLGELATGVKTGDSIAVNGVCLTVSALSGGVAGFDVSGETLAISNLGSLAPPAKVNVERALRADGRFGGHIVLGHVDGTATVRSIRRKGRFAEVEFAAEAPLLQQMVAKGSVAVDGVSLTVAGLGPEGFSAAVIPETLGRTTLGTAKAGDKVNIELDIITKSVKRLLERIMPAGGILTVEKLKSLGF
jgi:riboflavin synthase